MTRSKVVEAKEAVIAAARRADWTRRHYGSDSINAGLALRDMSDAVFALDALTPGPIVNSPGASVVGSPETSSQAAAALTPVSGNVRTQVLNCIASSIDGLLTCEMVERHLKMRHATASSAINWLAGEGWLQDSRQRAYTSSKRKAVLWQLTPAAAAQLRGRT